MATPSLFGPIATGPHRLRNRMVMAPLTRSRAAEGAMPTELMEIYYAQRAEAGLIVSEGTVVSPQGAAYPRVPGLYNEEQVRAWRRITTAVHERGGLIFAQLWHVGRQSHSTVQPDHEPPWAPSAVPIVNYQYYRKPERLPYETPRPLTREGIRRVCSDYANAAERAIRAGFDGVELHGANGYLIDQFLNSTSNTREDEYGGSIPHRTRFLHQVLDAVGERIPLSCVGVRLSPSSNWMDAEDADKKALHSYVVRSLNSFDLAYLHLVEPAIAGSTSAEIASDAVPTEMLSALFHGPVITTGGHDRESAQKRLNDGSADLIGFGRDFISNPDLPERLRAEHPLTPADKKGFYSGGAHGYITYPSIAQEQQWLDLRQQICLGRLNAEELHTRLAARDILELARDGDLYAFTRLQTLLDETVDSTV